ncbi:hypothetical protein QLX67_00395 [Balneolaceae bacterium ANBcel3]|nr:hypothetical protein [Balneolaceae bacterium ANBcel3]
MNYLILIDAVSGGDVVFLKSLATAIGRHKKSRGIILHSDNLLSGLSSEADPSDSQFVDRSIRELNKKLVALFADYGIPVIGMHGYQKSIIQIDASEIRFEKAWFDAIPSGVSLVLSNLVLDTSTSNRTTLPQGVLADSIVSAFGLKQLITLCRGLSSAEKSKKGLMNGYILPGETEPLNTNVYVLDEEDLLKGRMDEILSI